MSRFSLVYSSISEMKVLANIGNDTVLYCTTYIIQVFSPIFIDHDWKLICWTCIGIHMNSLYVVSCFKAPLTIFFFKEPGASSSTAESGGRQCCACPLDLCYTKMRHSHRRLHPDTFVAHPCSQAVGQCIFSLTLMGHRMSPLTSRHVQH